MKKCTKCEEELPDKAFAKNRTKKDGLASCCKSCQSEYRKDYYRRNKEKVKSRIASRQKQIYEWFKEYKSNLSCEKCGFNDHIAALDFHHIANKERNISAMASQGFAKETIIEEIDKCEVLCKNCHAIEHHGDRC